MADDVEPRLSDDELLDMRLNLKAIYNEYTRKIGSNRKFTEKEGGVRFFNGNSTDASLIFTTVETMLKVDAAIRQKEMDASANGNFHQGINQPLAVKNSTLNLTTPKKP